MTKISDFQILTGRTTDELTVAVKAALSDGWEPLEGGFQVEDIDQTAANYVMAMVKLPEAATRKTATRKTKTVSKKKSRKK